MKKNIKFINLKRNTLSIQLLADDLIEIRLFSNYHSSKGLCIYSCLVNKKHFFNKISELLKVQQEG